MTASALVTIFCDAPRGAEPEARCGWWQDAGIGDTAREARAGAMRAGWLIERGRDVCPACRRRLGL